MFRSRQLIAFIVTLQFLAGSAFAAKTNFVNGNPQTRTPGTQVTAQFLNAVNNHRHDGTAVDGSGILDYAVDTGSANTIAIALTPALTAHVEGMPVWLKVAANNTGATTIAVNGLAAVPLTKLGAAPLVAGDIKAGQIIGVSYSGTGYQLTNYQSPPVTDASTLNGQTAAQITPAGAVMAFAMPTAPDGWLICDGRAVLRSQYPVLYAAIGTTWGAGDNVSTFNLPDLRGEFLRGADLGRGVDAGRVVGSFQGDEVGSHRHPVYTAQNDATDADDGAGYGLSKSFDTPSIPDGVPELQNGAIGPAGGDETRPRNIAVLYCVKY